MVVRVHDFIGGSSQPVASYVAGSPGSDDEGAPPPMPAGGRVTRLNTDGDIIHSEEDIARDAALMTKKIAAAKATTAPEAVPRPNDLAGFSWVDETPKALRARCLEIASRSGLTSVPGIIAAARELLSFVENG